MAVSFRTKKGNVMAKAYKCDLCGKFINDCYAVSGIDIYPSDLRKMGIDQGKKHEVREICRECSEKIDEIVQKIFKENNPLATTKK